MKQIPYEERSMSTSMLYHTMGIRGYRYVSTKTSFYRRYDWSPQRSTRNRRELKCGSMKRRGRQPPYPFGCLGRLFPSRRQIFSVRRCRRKAASKSWATIFTSTWSHGRSLLCGSELVKSCHWHNDHVGDRKHQRTGKTGSTVLRRSI